MNLASLSAGAVPDLSHQQMQSLRRACRWAAAALFVIAVVLAGVIPGGSSLVGAGFWVLRPAGLATGVVLALLAAAALGASRRFADWSGSASSVAQGAAR